MQNNSLKNISDFDDVLKFIDARKDATKKPPEKKEPIPPRYRINFLDEIFAPKPSGKKPAGLKPPYIEILVKETYYKETIVEESSNEERSDSEVIDRNTPDKDISDKESSDEYPTNGETANAISNEQTASEDVSGEEPEEQPASGADESIDNELLIYDSSIKTSSDKEITAVEPIAEKTSSEKTSSEETSRKETHDEQTFHDVILPITEKNIIKGSVLIKTRPKDAETDSEVKSAIPSTGADISKPILFEKKSVKKILLVEEDMVLRKSLYYSLSEEGFYVVEADNGMDAIKKIQTEHFDQIVMYFQMQMLGGMELIRILRKDLGLATPLNVITSTGEKDADQESFTLMTD